MSQEPIDIDFTDNEKSMIEVVLGHLAKEEEMNDPEAAQEFREIINTIRSGDPISELDCHTVWLTLDRKSSIEFPAQPYDENKVSQSAKEKIEEAVEYIPQHLKHS